MILCLAYHKKRVWEKIGKERNIWELNCDVYDAKVRASAGENAQSSPMISCEVDLQCRVRSGGASCVKAIKDVFSVDPSGKMS